MGDLEPEHWKFGGGPTDTVLHPIVLVAMIIAVVVILFLPRRYMIATLLFSIFLIPHGQLIWISGLHVFVSRIIYLAAGIRLLWNKMASQKPIMGPWNSVDTAFLLMTVYHAFAFSVLYLQTAAFVNQMSFLWDFLGAYFIFRCAIQDEEDINKAVRCYAILTLILSACMVYEQLTGRNIFAVLGGIAPFPETRNGWVRAQGVFQHAILAGTFGATLLPVFLWLWKGGKSKILAMIGVAGTFAMPILSICSTPVLALLASITGIAFWPFRKKMRLFRWGVVAALAGLAVVMRSPVWWLIAHVGIVDGSSANHRAELVDTFMRHFSDWWLLGTDSNGQWGYLMFDTSNQYVNMGVTGGLLSLIGLILVISFSFRRLGLARKVVEGKDRTAEWRLWFLGSALFAHTIAFLGISYFDQTQVAWISLLAIICAATRPYLESRKEATVQQPAFVGVSKVPYRWGPVPKPALSTPAGPAKQGFNSRKLAGQPK